MCVPVYRSIFECVCVGSYVMHILKKSVICSFYAINNGSVFLIGVLSLPYQLCLIQPFVIYWAKMYLHKPFLILCVNNMKTNKYNIQLDSSWGLEGFDQ